MSKLVLEEEVQHREEHLSSKVRALIKENRVKTVTVTFLTHTYRTPID